MGRAVCEGGDMDRRTRVFLALMVAIGLAALIAIFAMAARGQELDPGICQEGEASGAPAGG